MFAGGFAAAAGVSAFLFIALPILLLGGCAALIATSSSIQESEERSERERAAKLEPSATDLQLVARLAERKVEEGSRESFRATCRYEGKRTMDFVPDDYFYRCVARNLSVPGAVTIVGVGCFDEPPGHQRSNCVPEDAAKP